MNLDKFFNFQESSMSVAAARSSAMHGVFSNLFARKNNAGVEVTLSTAQSHSAVMACFRVLSESIASMPIHIMKREIKNGQPHSSKAYDHPLYNILHTKPNNDMTKFSFIEALMMNTVSRGKAFAQKIVDGRGKLIGLYPLLTDNMRVVRSNSGALGFIYDSEKHGEVWLDQNEIVHFVGMSFDGVNGLSPIEYSAPALGLSMAMEEYASNFFSNGANVGGVYEMPTKLSDPAYNRLRSSLKEKYEGLRNSGKPMLLEEGLSFKQIGVNNNDSQFLESRTFQLREIARIFRVPPHLIGDLERATFSNIEQQSLEFATYSLLPWVERFEQALNIALLDNDPEHYISFNMDAMLRGDTKSRYDAYGQAIRDGHMTRNEVRVLEGRNPIDGLDEPLIPLNMTEGRETEDEKN